MDSCSWRMIKQSVDGRVSLISDSLQLSELLLYRYLFRRIEPERTNGASCRLTYAETEARRRASNCIADCGNIKGLICRYLGMTPDGNF